MSKRANIIIVAVSVGYIIATGVAAWSQAIAAASVPEKQSVPAALILGIIAQLLVVVAWVYAAGKIFGLLKAHQEDRQIHHTTDEVRALVCTPVHTEFSAKLNKIEDCLERVQITLATVVATTDAATKAAAMAATAAATASESATAIANAFTIRRQAQVIDAIHEDHQR